MLSGPCSLREVGILNRTKLGSLWFRALSSSFSIWMRSVCHSWRNTDVTEGQGSIKSDFTSYGAFAWVLHLGCQGSRGHCGPLLICYLWNQCIPPAPSFAEKQTRGCFSSYSQCRCLCSWVLNNNKDRKANPCSKKPDFSNETFYCK